MKAYKVINQNGLFFNKETGKQVILKEKHEFLITAEDEAFAEQDSLNIAPEKLMDSDEIYKFISIKYGPENSEKIFSRNQTFIFHVGMGKNRENNNGWKFVFVCRLLEDLYAYKNRESDFVRLCNCHCVVEECIAQHDKMFFEPIYADSLNQAASNTISHLFSLKRVSSLNVLKEFKEVSNIEQFKLQLKIDSDFIYRYNSDSIADKLKSIFP